MFSFISTRKGLVIYESTDSAWKRHSIHFEGIPVSLTHYDKARNQLWAFLDHGHWGIKVHRSSDFGQHWEALPAPAYAEGVEIKTGKKASVRYIWAAQSMPLGSAFEMHIGTDPGGLFSWQEESQSWHLNESLWNRPERQNHWFGGGRDQPGIHSIVVDPQDANHIYVGISCAGVYETRDGGHSWAGKNKGLRADFLPDPYSEYGHDPHMLVQCKSTPQVLWQQNHCGIFKSDNGGDSWVEVSEKEGPAIFGFAIAVDDKDPNIAYVAPGVSDEIRMAVNGQLCISKTIDGGKTWTAQRNGLPQKDAFDIVYRHSISNVGDRLMFGSTTGNVFYSNNGGDHWHVLSNYLPMVYAVEMIE